MSVRSLPLLALAVLCLCACYGDVTRNVRRQFVNDYACRDFVISERREGVSGRGFYTVHGCGRVVEYDCRTRERTYVAGEQSYRRRDTFCNARLLNPGVAIADATRARPRTPRASAARVTDTERGLTYIGLTLSEAWWELRFIAPEQDGRATGEVVVVLRAATPSSRLQSCGGLTLTTNGDVLHLPSSEGEAEGRLVRYRTTIEALRSVASSSAIRLDACNVRYAFDSEALAGLRQLVILAASNR